MINKSMELMLGLHECLDLAALGAVQVRPGVWEMLPGTFQEGVDYCHAPTEQWIWSIGTEKTTGKTYAGTTAEFYEDSRYTCIWLR